MRILYLRTLYAIVKIAKPKTGKKPPPRAAAAADDLISKLSQLSSGKPVVKPIPASPASSDASTKPLLDKPKPNGKAAAVSKVSNDGSASESIATEKPIATGAKAKGPKNNTAKRPPTGTAPASDHTAGADTGNGAATDVTTE